MGWPPTRCCTGCGMGLRFLLYRVLCPPLTDVLCRASRCGAMWRAAGIPLSKLTGSAHGNQVGRRLSAPLRPPPALASPRGSPALCTWHPRTGAPDRFSAAHLARVLATSRKRSCISWAKGQRVTRNISNRKHNGSVCRPRWYSPANCRDSRALQYVQDADVCVSPFTRTRAEFSFAHQAGRIHGHGQGLVANTHRSRTAVEARVAAIACPMRGCVPGANRKTAARAGARARHGRTRSALRRGVSFVRRHLQRVEPKCADRRQGCCGCECLSVKPDTTVHRESFQHGGVPNSRSAC